MAISRLGNGFTILAFLGFSACSAAPVSTGVANHGAGGSGNNGGAGSGANGASYNPGTGGAPITPVVDGGRPPRCDADSGKCTCINIAEFGKTGTFGASQNNDGSTAFQDWLNGNSSAHVDVYAGGTTASDRTTITSDLLSNYDVIVLQSLSANPSSTQQSDYWVFTQPEIDAVTDWVTNKGGAIIALTGYFSDNSYEINPTNQLINFSGLTFDPDDIVEQADCPVNAAANQQTCYCWGNSIPITDWNTASPIAQHVTAVGAFRGRSITIDPSFPSANFTVVATFNETSGSYAGKTYNFGVSALAGNGRIFAWGDEWITYNSQWDDSVLNESPSAYTNPYDPCYNQLPTQVFQIPQFWYNVLKWCYPLVSCFTITTPPGQPQIIVD